MSKLTIFIILLINIFSSLHAQVSTPQAIFNQIPPVPQVFICEDPAAYNETKDKINLLISQIEETGIKLNAEMLISGENSYNELSVDFPTDEELQKLEKLSEKEQEAYWAKIEERQIEFDKSIEGNLIKYQEEKEKLSQQLISFNNESLDLKQEFDDVLFNANKVISDKRQNIYDTCVGADNNLTESGKQQIEKIRTEYCSTVSSSYLNSVKFEYLHLKQTMDITRRLSVIQLMEYSPLREEEVCQQNAALIALNELAVLSLFLDSYKQLLEFLPVPVDYKGY